MSTYLVIAYRHHPATVQYHVVAVLELVGLVFSPLKDRAVHRSNRAVVSSAPDLDPVASPQILLHAANVENCHTAGQGGWVTEDSRCVWRVSACRIRGARIFAQGGPEAWEPPGPAWRSGAGHDSLTRWRLLWDNMNNQGDARVRQGRSVADCKPRMPSPS